MAARGKDTPSRVWRSSRADSPHFLPRPEGVRLTCPFSSSEIRQHACSVSVQTRPREIPSRGYLVRTSPVATLRQEQRPEFQTLEGKAETTTLSHRELFRGHIPRCQPRNQALLKMRPVVLTPFCVILLRAQRKLTLVAERCLTVQNTLKALGLDRYGCDSHMTLNESLLLFLASGVSSV